MRPITLALLFVLTTFWLPCLAQDTGMKFTRFAGFQLGKGTLFDVERKLGSTKLVESGEAGEYVVVSCYRTNTGIVSFLSGEMGGKEHDLLGFLVGINDTTKPCSRYPKKLAPPRLEIAGLRLGLTKAQFVSVVGTKVQWSGDIGQAFFESKRPMIKSEIESQPKAVQMMIASAAVQNYFDVSVSVSGIFISGKLVEYMVWKVESL